MTTQPRDGEFREHKETSMSKHTPGPWTFVQDMEPRIVGANEDTVVNLTGAMGGQNTGADARLIAAAPDLLAACKALYAVSADCPYNSEKCAEMMAEAGWNETDRADEPWDEYADRIARAAIAKAEAHQ